MKFPMFIQDLTGKNKAEVPGAGLPKDTPFFLEQFKALRAKIDDLIDKEVCKTLAVTSSIAEEGKTITCINLAMNMAYTGRRKVLLVDTDMRKSDVGRGMNLNRIPGLSEFLSGAVKITDVIKNSKVPGLYVIPSGSCPSAPADMLAGESFRKFIQSSREHFDFVLLDTPPVLPVADTHSLREQVDGFLLVYRAGHTPYPILKQVIGVISEEKILGVVINRVKPRTDKYYRKYYGKYYNK
jgi:capsular exopolysaccharide synthesis family protein